MNTIGDLVYIFGGINHSKFLNNLYKLDPFTYEIQMTEQNGNVPEPRAYHWYHYYISI